MATQQPQPSHSWNAIQEHASVFENVRKWCDAQQIKVNDTIYTHNGTICNVLSIKDNYIRAEVTTSPQVSLINRVITLYKEPLIFFAKLSA